jgi:hypothetical protein
MEIGRIRNTCTQHGSTGQQLECIQKICFTHSQDKRDIYHVYTMYTPCIYQSLDSPGPLCCPRSFGSIGPGLASDLLVLATERPPTRGWGRPKFHSQVLISKTWLPLREVGPASQHSKASRCRLLYLSMWNS